MARQMILVISAVFTKNNAKSTAGKRAMRTIVCRAALSLMVSAIGGEKW